MLKDSSSDDFVKTGSSPDKKSKAFWRTYLRIHKPKGFGSPTRVILSAFLIFLLSQIAAGILVGIFLSFRGINSLNYDINGSSAAQFFYILIAEGLSVWLVLYVIKRRSLSLGAIGLGRKPVRSDIVRAVLGFIAFYGLLIVAGTVLSFFVPDINNQQQDVGFNALNSSTDQLLALIALVILPPLGEEVLVRGYLYSGLRRSWRFMPAMIVTSLLFGLAHLQSGANGLVWAASVDTLLLSVVLVYLRERTGALYAGILVHMANNFIAFGVHFHTLL